MSTILIKVKALLLTHIKKGLICTHRPFNSKLIYVCNHIFNIQGIFFLDWNLIF